MRIGAVQCLTVPDDLDHVCDVLAWRLEWADREAIDLVLFPEAFVLGHSYDPQTIEWRAQRNSTTALPIVCDRLRGFRATLVVGAFERQGSTVVNSAMVIENGCVIGRYAKAYPFSKWCLRRLFRDCGAKVLTMAPWQYDLSDDLPCRRPPR